MNVDVILNITNAVLGVAGTIVVLALLFVLGLAVKSLPTGLRRAVSALFAVAFAATFLTGIVWQALYVLASRSMLYAVLSLKFVGVSAVFGLFLFSMDEFRYVLSLGKRSLKGLVFDEGKTSNFVKGKKSSSSSFELKVSSVLLQ